MANSVYNIVQTIVFLIPVAALIWKASAINSKVDDNEKRILKLETSEKEFRSVVSDIKESLKGIEIALARIDEKIKNKEE